MKKLLLAAAFIVMGHANAQQPPVEKFPFACAQTTRDSMQCKVVNESSEPGELCVDVVKVCKGGEHHAQLCSGQLQVGDSALKVVHGFYPKVKLLESCMGIEYRDKHINRPG